MWFCFDLLNSKPSFWSHWESYIGLQNEAVPSEFHIVFWAERTPWNSSDPLNMAFVLFFPILTMWLRQDHTPVLRPSSLSSWARCFPALVNAPRKLPRRNVWLFTLFLYQPPSLPHHLYQTIPLSYTLPTSIAPFCFSDFYGHSKLYTQIGKFGPMSHRYKRTSGSKLFTPPHIFNYNFHNFIFPHSWGAFQCIYVAQFHSPFIIWRTLMLLFSLSSYCEESKYLWRTLNPLGNAKE